MTNSDIPSKASTNDQPLGVPNSETQIAAASQDAVTPSQNQPPPAIAQSAADIRRQRREAHQQHQRDLRSEAPQRPDTGGFYVFLATTMLMFGVWFAGPKLVEEYHYAASTGTTRAEYEHASEILDSDPLASVSYAYQMVAQKVRPSVVSITSRKQPDRRPRTIASTSSGLGSGVIISADGYIVTNAHVLDGGYRFEVELHDRRRFAAQLIGADTGSDLALLKINCNNLIAAQWGDSDELDVGSIVWAFGNPYQLKQTVTSGIISGKDRPGEWETRRNEKQALLQTDAAINRGNSGGPLVDSHGQVIGINTAILGETFQGIGFAVPSATARYVVDQLRENGTVTRGFLGAKPVEVSNADARQFGLPDLHGAKLLAVVENSPAAKAGMQSADVIRTWNGVPIHDYKTLYRLAEMTPPNSQVEVTLLREGEEFRTTVRVGDRTAALGGR